MELIETDYLIVGAGASGMSFADVLVSQSDFEVTLVDRRHQPGGHWVDAYPFVQLHQPSAYYGVNSKPLGQDRIDTSGINAGFYERAEAAEIQDYYRQVLNRTFLPSGRVRFLSASDYLGKEDGHHVVHSNLSGKDTRIKVRRGLVDARIIESSIPARHTPSYSVDDGVQLVTPNQLVDVVDAKGYTLLGGGKTAMDVCFWLIQQGVAPDDICWVRPRESWMSERTFTQPLELSANMVRMQAVSVQAAAEATSPLDYYLRMEAAGTSLRINPNFDPVVQRGATISLPELEVLREIENVVHGQYVQSIGSTKVITRQGEFDTNAGRIYVDCTAAGVGHAPASPIFEDEQINLHPTTLGVTPWSAAVVAFVTTLDMSLEEKNKLCPPLPRTGDIYGTMKVMRIGLPAETARRGVSEIAEWSASSRLNPGRSIPNHMEDPEVKAAFARMMQYFQAAQENVVRLTEQSIAS
ncbi:MAG: NAD(P)-binding protein [Pseudomonadota bacterium]